MKSRLRDGEQLMSPGVGELGKAVQKYHAGSPRWIKAGFEDVHSDAVVIVDVTRTNAGGQSGFAVLDILVSRKCVSWCPNNGRRRRIGEQRCRALDKVAARNKCGIRSHPIILSASNTPSAITISLVLVFRLGRSINPGAAPLKGRTYHVLPKSNGSALAEGRNTVEYSPVRLTPREKGVRYQPHRLRRT